MDGPISRDPAAATWVPARVRALPEPLELWNALVGHLGAELPLAGTARAVAELDDGPAPDAACLAVRFAAGPEILVAPIAFPFASAFGADLAVADFPLLPAALREALNEGLVAVLAGLVPEHGFGAAGIVGEAPLAARTEAAPLRWFRVAVHGLAAEPAELRVGATAAALGALFGGRLAPRRVSAGLGAAITREAAYTLGRLDMTRAELAELTPGAVVILEAGIEDTARLRVGAEVFHFRAAEQGWACIAVAGPETGPAEGESGAQMDSEAPTRPVADRLDVAIDLDLGRIAVPLAELETWAVGSIVALQPPRPGEGVEVSLRANGRLIGTGEIVRVDDRLGVRLSRLSPGA